jgi:DNA replication initiation complex subunit (GINS family)
MNYRERIRKSIECPQFGNETYGEWGALNLEQRKYIKRLLDELDRADNYIESVYLENEQLKDNWNKLKEYIKETKLKEFEKSYGKRYGKTFTQAEIIICNMILDKMQELEQGSDSNE